MCTYPLFTPTSRASFGGQRLREEKPRCAEKPHAEMQVSRQCVFSVFLASIIWHEMPRMRQAMNDGNKFTAGIDGSMRKSPSGAVKSMKGFSRFLLLLSYSIILKNNVL